MWIFRVQLSLFVGFGIIVAVCSLSVPGLLDFYKLVEKDDVRRVFKLGVRVDAEHFKLTAKLAPADPSWNIDCEQFFATTTGNVVELWLKKDELKMKPEEYQFCSGKLSLHVTCESVSGGTNDCENSKYYQIVLSVFPNV